MRIFAPAAPSDEAPLRAGAARIDLEAGRLAWGVSAQTLAENPGADLEDLEYEAIQDAAYAAFQEKGASDRRIIILAGDVPDSAVEERSAEGGAFGLRLREGAQMLLASAHVSELVGADAAADDTDPALLWFDRSEGASALAFAEGEDAAGS